MGVVSALECLSTSALLPSDETGTLWEQVFSGAFYVPCMEREWKRHIACKTKPENSVTPSVYNRSRLRKHIAQH